MEMVRSTQIYGGGFFLRLNSRLDEQYCRKANERGFIDVVPQEQFQLVCMLSLPRTMKASNGYLLNKYDWYPYRSKDWTSAPEF